ncbi:MAG: AAA family ATPase [Pirellulaceae bacterium]
MSTADNSNAILGLLSGKRVTPVEKAPWNPATARPTEDQGAEESSLEQDAKLTELLSRIQQMTSPDPRKSSPPSTIPAATAQPGVAENGGAAIAPLDAFIPLEPNSTRAAGLTDTEVESLVLKYLLARGDMTGREIAEQIRMPFILLDQLMRQLKLDQLLIYRGSAPMNDYIYQLTDLGRERARRYLDHCTYFGAAPVALADYISAIEAQSLTRQHPTEEDLKNAFSDIIVNQKMLTRLGPAINSGRGMFLFGSAGNGKTTIAERVTRAFGQFIWIPRAIGIDGEIIRLFDPVNHEEVPPPANSTLWNSSKVDQRWVRIRRPTIVVGGELTMDSLEVCLNRSTGISEAPLQLKSNCGTLVIDDFGRQKMSTDQLLNRWIVPLEKRYDYLNLPNGKKIQVPFDQLIVFSTNLEPRDLVDEAFLRRIPYKIEVVNPSEEEFRSLFKYMCPKLGFEYDEGSLNYLIETHYKAKNRPFRACQPRDLLTQVKNHCYYQKLTPRMSTEYFDLAVENYFAVM